MYIKAKHLRRAKKYQNFTVGDQTQVLFTDESKVKNEGSLKEPSSLESMPV